MTKRVYPSTSAAAVNFTNFNLRKWTMFKLFFILVLTAQLASIICNVTTSLLLQNNQPTSSTSTSAELRDPPTDDKDSHCFDSTFIHSLINSTDYSDVDRYTNYTLRVLKRRNNKYKTNQKNKPSRGNEEVNNVTSFHYPIDIGPCKPVNGSLMKSLFVGVVSAPVNFQRRRDIRLSWLRHLRDERIVQPQSNSSVNIVGFSFVLGQTKDAHVQAQIEKESLVHGDILQVQMMDDYYDLAVKGVAFFNWLNDNCPDADFVLKADDDVYVNVRNLTSVVAALPFPSFPAPVSVYGFNETIAFPKRDESKWHVGWELWPWKTYPSYLLGPAVLIPGGEGVRRLLNAAKTTPYFRIDDVYLNGLLPEKAKMNVTSLKRFYCPSALMMPSPCFAQFTASWLTNSSDHMLSSHAIVDRLYLGNDTQCVEGKAPSQCLYFYKQNKNGTRDGTEEYTDDFYEKPKTTEVDEKIFLELLNAYQEAVVGIIRMLDTNSTTNLSTTTTHHKIIENETTMTITA